MVDYVAFDTRKAADSSAGLTIVAGDFITTPSGVDECDSPIRISGQNVVLNVGCVQSLLGYAVAKENNSVSIFESKIALLLVERNA